MGCDGGSIPKRNEIVKEKRKDATRDKDADREAKWLTCNLSGLQLKKPIVACQLGRLYNRLAVIEHLLELKSPINKDLSPSPVVSHIKCLKDVKELNLKEKSDFDKDHKASSGRERLRAQFVCPISGLDMNGKYRFFYLLSCGCVISERALKEVPNGKQCIVCFKPYDPELDLIVLNGDDSEINDLRSKISIRRSKSRDSKRLRQDSGSVSKDGHSKKDYEVPGPSKRHKSQASAIKS